MSRQQQKRAEKTAKAKKKRHERRILEQWLHRPDENDDKIYLSLQPGGKMEYN